MAHTDAEIRSLLYLHRLVGDRPRQMCRLLSIFGSAEQVLHEAHPGLFEELRLPKALTSAFFFAEKPAQRLLDRDMAWLDVPNHHLLQLGDVAYPSLLATIHDPPPVLFADGDIGLLANDQLAIVGSRKLSMSGRKTATRMAAGLSSAGLTITSGLALGIDAAAHRGALQANGPTIAVLGCGCDLDYPPSNRALAADIRSSGLVVSEFALGSRADPYHFPQRNRIVTGMSLGTLVVEAALKSGSLISARLASEQGREVFAIPGSIDGIHHKGCHQLIRSGAKLTESVGDILVELPGYEPCADTDGFAERSRRLEELVGIKKTLVTCLGDDPVTVDELTETSGLPVHEVLAHLIELEVAGIISSDAGGYILAPIRS
ncbi:MAG: DNA-processing protein DprA [Pseudomonadales bacterium]